MAAPTPAPERLARRLVPLALIFGAVGLSTSFVIPYLALFLTAEVHAGPLRTTAFLVVAPVSGVVVSWLVGRLSDRRPIRRRLMLLAALVGVAGTWLIAVIRDYWVLLAVTVTLVALANTLFPQSFAYARQVLQRGDPARAAMGISMLRTIFSVAWVGGPPLAALVLAARGFSATYACAAGMYVFALLVVFFGLPEVGDPGSSAPSEGPGAGSSTAPRRTIVLVIAGFIAVQVTTTLGVQAMPLYVSDDLGGSVRDAGLILGLCAALEIPLMLGFGALSTRFPPRRLILFGVFAAIAYQALATASETVWMLAAAQLFNAVGIATVSGLGISYAQDLMPEHPGRATTMITNTFPAGQILAGPLFGVAQHFGFRLAYGLNLALGVVSLLLLFAAGRPKVPKRPTPQVSEGGPAGAG